MKFLYYRSIKIYTCIILFTFLQIQCSQNDESDNEVLSEINQERFTDAQEILILVNISRAEENLEPLTLNNKLNQAALAHSEDMEANDYFDHISLDGTTPFERTRSVEYEGAYKAENIAWNGQSYENVHNSWMNSDGHRAAILSSNSNEMGLGRSGPYWTQLFGYSE